MSTAIAARDSIDVLLVDDHPIVRQGVRNLLESTAGLRVVGEAGDAASALRMAADLQPDIALVDIMIDGQDWVGIELVPDLRRLVPRMKVIMLSQFGDPFHVYSALEAGARGYIVKLDGADEYLRIIDAVLADATALSSGAELRQDPDGPRITPAQAGVLKLIAQGFVQETIAIMLKIKLGTVKKHVQNVRENFSLHIQDRDDFKLFIQSGRWLAYVDWGAIQLVED